MLESGLGPEQQLKQKMREFARQSKREARTDSVDAFMFTNYLGASDARVERCLGEVLHRLPEKAADAILHNNCLVVIYANSVSARAHRIVCPGHPQPVEYWLHIVTLTEELRTMSDEAAIGAIAHEFAHVFLRLTAPHRDYKNQEEEANNLASKWGFIKEIQAVRQWGASWKSGADCPTTSC